MSLINIKKKGYHENDEYYTPKYAIEPFDMEWSNYVKMLSKDHEVIYTHKDTGGDFFKIEVPECDAIVSNIPFSLKTEIFERLFEIDKPYLW